VKELDFDFDTNINNDNLLSCEDCSHTWISENEPYKIKRGMMVIEDDCPNCGNFISKCI
jgi:hypothetical protein